MDFLPDSIAEYAEKFSSPEPDVLKKLNRDTHAKVLRPRMLAGHLQGRLLSFISRMVNPERILEIGTYTGYSAICLAEGLQENGLLHTIDHNPELRDFAAGFIRQAGYNKQIIQHTGEAIDVLPFIDDRFDLVYLDADKTNYIRYFELIFPKLRQGGIVLADNVLWGGKVLEKVSGKDEETLGIVRFNNYVRKHAGVRNLLLPFRDGLMIIEKVSEA